jgi:protein farnesyltransferase subunit beta
MEVSRFLWVARKTCGIPSPLMFTLCIVDNSSGAYCAMVLISLLDLPIDLPSTSAAKLEDEDTLVTRLPEYLSGCK